MGLRFQKSRSAWFTPEARLVSSTMRPAQNDRICPGATRVQSARTVHAAE